MKLVSAIFLIVFSPSLWAQSPKNQSFLPPVLPWKGKSEALIAPKSDVWITPIERADFKTTPDYEATAQFLFALCKDLPKGLLVNDFGNDNVHNLIYCATTPPPSKQALDKSKKKKRRKPVLLIQAGIHSGEIDGKDAGLMFWRDVAKGKFDKWLQQVDVVLVPVFNIGGHESQSIYNRPNQRGPENMGLRTNGANLNLNRDYMKAESAEMRAMLGLIQDYKPDLYMDIHVTDGADYQYDITYGYVRNGHSPAIGSWLDTVFTPYVNKELEAMGHIPGPFLNTTNGRDFSDGNSEYYYGPNFSHGYGDLVHIPTILVENHSLKPYKQRVLGTYVLIESVMKLLAEKHPTLQKAIKADLAKRDLQVPYAWRVPKKEKPDSLLLKGIKSRIKKSTITGGEYVEWLGIPETKKVAIYKEDEPWKFVKRPRGYLVPKECKDILNHLHVKHKIQYQLYRPSQPELTTQYKMTDPTFATKPFEGRIQVVAKAEKVERKPKSGTEYYYIPTDQPLGDLAVLLLEPEVNESLFQWGYFNSIFQRTEYAEDYFLEPMAEQMLNDSPSLLGTFEQKKKDDPAFAKNPRAILEWFYAQSPYYDQRYQWYPILRVE